MKLRLIQPSQLDEQGRPIKYEKLFLPFLTMVTLAGLTPPGVDVAITEDCVEDIDFDEDVDLVAITGQTCQAPRAYQIADEFRKRGKKTIIGGIHASLCPQEALQHCDALLIGEAEDIWETVLADARSGNLKRVYQAPDKPELSKPAIPRFDLLNYANYVIPPFAKTPLLPFQTTRGCPHGCDFCAVVAYLGRKIRRKPVSNVVREIEAARPSRILFTDDNIVADPRHARELFEAIKPFKTRWACQMSARILDHPDLIDLAAESGCHETLIGIESLNDATLVSVHKTHNKTGQYAEMFRRLKEAGILAQGTFVFGFDEDSRETLRRSLDTILSWDMNYMYIFVLTPFPGTKLHERMAKDGRILSGDWSLYDAMHPVLQFKNISADDLSAAMWEAYGRFYSIPSLVKRAFRFMKQYIVFFPRDMLIEELFFQFFIRNAVRRRLHPFTLGLRKESGQ